MNKNKVVLNKSIGTPNWRPYLFVFALGLACNLNAQKIGKYYSSFPQEEGTLYFIESRTNIKGNHDKSKFDYDLTHLSVNDSVTMNFTIISSKILAIDSLGIFGDHGAHLTENVEKVFLEDDKKNLWKHRYSVVFSYSPFIKIYEGESFKISVYTEGNTLDFVPHGRRWSKEKNAFLKIFKMIQANK